MKTDKTFPWVEAGEGVRRRILAENPQAMTVRVEFTKGAVGEPHHHSHVQTIFVKSGKFEFTVDGQVTQYAAGDSLVIPSDVVHGCVALEDGTLIDSFVPRRDDFL
ncbi:MAG: cupin domain-containing protein [Rhizobiaceae bacterium]